MVQQAEKSTRISQKGALWGLLPAPRGASRGGFPAALNQETEGATSLPRPAQLLPRFLRREALPLWLFIFQVAWSCYNTWGPELWSTRLYLGRQDWGWEQVDRSHHWQPGPGSSWSAWLLPETRARFAGSRAWVGPICFGLGSWQTF